VSDAGQDASLRAGLEAIAAVLRTGRLPELPAGLAGDGELTRIIGELASLNRFVLAVSNGDLDRRLEMRGNVAGALKGLQASLRHLTWQTQRVAGGDFTQRVDFMGDFSDAFNSMVAALEQMTGELARRNEELDQRNEQLLAQAFKLEELATHDSLTGVVNRRKFNELIVDEFERVRRYGSPLSFVILDIDHFKQVNDTLGHEAGDQVLVAVAQLLGDGIRSVDTLARWGGEEFVLLLPQVSAPGARDLADRLRREVRAGRLPGDVTVSCGVAEHRPPETPDGLFARADAALYRAKAEGRDRVVVAG
jgi:diguanylate cyclase (GGDEF)-like protein